MGKQTDFALEQMSQVMQEIFEATEYEIKEQVGLALLHNLHGFSDVGHYKLHLAQNRIKLGKELQQAVSNGLRLVQHASQAGFAYLGVDPVAYISHSEMTGRLLVKSASEAYTKASLKMQKGQKQYHKTVRLTATDDLYDKLSKQIDDGIENAAHIKTKSGKHWGYKEYMEMAIRTETQKEMSKNLVEHGTKAGIVFYICNSFGDCADDHADYQGKIYYSKHFRSHEFTGGAIAKIENHIAQTGMLSIQDVILWDPKRGKNPSNHHVGITTRPNCRHKFTPISIDQALNIPEKKLLQLLKLDRGTYKKKNADDREQQRYNERMIRKYKNDAFMEENFYKQMISTYGDDKDPILGVVRKRLARARAMTRQWEAKQRELMKANPNLDRDYKREDRFKVNPDMGATLAHKIKNQPTPPPTPLVVPPAPQPPVSPSPPPASKKTPPDASGGQPDINDLIDKIKIVDDKTIHKASESYGKLRDSAATAWKQWSYQERTAAREYTGSAYSSMNRSLRGGGGDAATKAKVKDLQMAIDKASFPTDLTVIRQIHHTSAFKLLGLDINGDLQKALWGSISAIEEMTKIVTGQVISDPGFMSTSASTDKPYLGPDSQVDMLIYLPAGSKAVYAEPFSSFGSSGLNDPSAGYGVDWGGDFLSIPPGGAYVRGENEVIVQAGTKMRVLGVDLSTVLHSGKRKMTIRLEALPNG